MANKLRTSNARVSFFAFLDMITAVTGVLVLITLLITLYLNDTPATAATKDRDAVREQVDQARAVLEAKIADLRQRQLQAAALTNRLFLVPERDRSGREPVLIVLSATNGICNRLGQTNLVEFARSPDNPEFRRLLAGWDSRKERLVFYVRPSGILHFRECRKLAVSRGFNIGYDPAGEDTQYLLVAP